MSLADNKWWDTDWKRRVVLGVILLPLGVVIFVYHGSVALWDFAKDVVSEW